MDVEINAAISFIDIFIGIVLVWAIYKGYKRSPIVHGIYLLVIIISLALFGSASTQIADYIQDRTNIDIDNAQFYIFALLFIASIFLANLISNKIEESEMGKPKNFLNVSLAILLNIIKYLYFLSIFFLFIAQLDNEYDFINSKEKNTSKLYKIVRNIAPETIRTVDFLKD